MKQCMDHLYMVTEIKVNAVNCDKSNAKGEKNSKIDKIQKVDGGVDLLIPLPLMK